MITDETVPASSDLPSHGAAQLGVVTVDTYNAELREPDGFLGDRASRRAFQAILDDWRERLRAVSGDPLGSPPTGELGKEQVDRLLTEGDSQAAGLVLSAVEEFAQELTAVIRRFLRLSAWRDTQRIMVGGGLRSSRVGELAIGRAAVLLQAGIGQPIDLRPIRHHPDEAGLLGAAQLAPAGLLADRDAILAVDIGGTKIRAGVVELNLRRAGDLSAAHVMDFALWRHAGDRPDRDAAVARLGEMLCGLATRAEKKGHRLAPFIGIGCPGIIAPDGTISRGAQNLPGGWEGSGFNLPGRLRALLPSIDGADTVVLMHNDAVVQGLSEVSCQTDVARWGVLTIGTGLGNARFSMRR